MTGEAVLGPSGAAPAPWRSRRKNRRSWTELWAGLGFMLPALVVVGCVTILPVAYAIQISVHRTNYAALGAFYGFGNFLAVFRDPGFSQSLLVSTKFVVGSLVFAIPLGLGLAILLTKQVRGRALFRTLIILPWVLSQTVTALLWLWLLNLDFGIVTLALRLLAGLHVDFFTPERAMSTLVSVNVWRSYPFAVIMFLAVLPTVPRDLYEAIQIDGGSGWAALRWVTLPWISPTLLITIMAMSIEYFNMVTLVLVLTGGAPLGLTETLSLRIFMEAFTNWRLGAATAMGMVVFALNALLCLLYFRMLRRRDR
jgi:multiple sugar transport system permease protein